jgi:uncharacterized protein
VRSAIYEGAVVHRRSDPDHGFRLRVAMPLIDLAEIDHVVAQHPLWSRERANAVSFRRSDFLGDPATDLDLAIRDLVEGETGRRPSGPIALLAHLRTWGWLFNPIAVYYCYDPTGHQVEHTVVEVTNTPWEEKHAYHLPPPGRDHVVDKAMHVSPFFGMDQSYRISYGAPGERLHLSIALDEAGENVFAAALHLRRHPVSRRALGEMLWRHPALTMRVSAGIHVHALRLWAKGATFQPHPAKGVTRAHSCLGESRTDEAA